MISIGPTPIPVAVQRTPALLGAFSPQGHRPVASQGGKAARTSKSENGAKVHATDNIELAESLLELLRQHLCSFTLSSVIEEIRRWAETGRSCFARWAEKLGLSGHGLSDDRRRSLLERVIPVPDG